MAIQGKLPEWWEWELHISKHVYWRMPKRGFNETDLREMLADATSLAPDVEPGRWVVGSRWEGEPWEIIVEPVPSMGRLAIITAYAVK